MSSLPEPKNEKTHPIQDIGIIVGNLAYACRQKGYSLRLLAAMMDTSYGVVYQSWISAKTGRGGVRGPTCHSDKALLKSNAGHLLAPMAARRITERKWCTAYNVELFALFNPVYYELNYDVPVLDYLREDFAESFGLTPAPYVHAYKEVEGFRHIHDRKKKIHMYKSVSGHVSVGRNNGDTLTRASKVQGLTFQAQRLQVLLDDGIEAALAWVPSRTEKLAIQLTDHEQAIFDELKQQTAIDDLYVQLAALPRQYLSIEQRASEVAMLLSLKKYGIPGDHIDFTIKSMRQKAGIY